MAFFKFCSICWTIAFVIVLIEGNYQCGIRKHSHIELTCSFGSKVKDGEWPWHVGLHKRSGNETQYQCGGTLIDRKYVVTAAHCVVIRDTNRSMPIEELVLHFGQNDLSTMTRFVQVKDVAKIVVHPEFSPRINDIALLELRIAVEYTDYVIPICLGNIRVYKDLRNLEGQRGWITGWGRTENGTLSSELRSASLPVVDYLRCVQNDPNLFGKVVNENVFCAGDLNGTTPGGGDSGGGMYFIEGDRWVLRGIISFAKIKQKWGQVDGSKYTVFVNVQRFLSWIREAMKRNSTEKSAIKRISEEECDRFKQLAEKSSKGQCLNSRYPHTVSIGFSKYEYGCTGILVNENHVLTTCTCAHGTQEKNGQATMVRIVDYGTVNISSFICHPAYTNENNQVTYDIAVITLEFLIDISSRVIPACLANNWTENLHDTLLITGFTSARSLTRNSANFFETDDNQIVTTGECNRWLSIWHYKSETKPTQLCVINNEKFRTYGPGSAGSPLQTMNTETCSFMVVGVHSGHSKDIIYGYKLVKQNLFFRVSNHLDWIEEMVWGARAVQQTET